MRQDVALTGSSWCSRVICRSSRQPLLDGARVLLAEGTPPDTRIGMRHAGSSHVALSSTVGAAAGLTRETSSEGPMLVAYRPYVGDL
jgi:hypothetical protein